jgi:hypothetical protein
MSSDRPWGLGWKKKPDAEPEFEAGDGASVQGEVTLAHIYKVLLAQQDEIDALKAQVARLGGGDRPERAFEADDDLQPFPVQDDAEDRGPGALPTGFFEPSKARPARAPFTPPATRPVAAAPARPAAPRQTAASENLSDLIARYTRTPEFKALVSAYQGLLDGAVGMATFTRDYGPDFVATGSGDSLRATVGEEEGPFWFIPLDDHPSIGLLLPSSGPIQQWAEQFQFGGGSRAHNVFGRAFEVEPGNVLQLMEPAWVRFDGDDIRLEKRGRLRGA